MIQLPAKDTFYSRKRLCDQLKCDWAQLKELSEHAGSYYSMFDETKGDKTRHFDPPKESLKVIQTRLARFLRSSVLLPKTMFGGIKGGSPQKNAAEHVGQRLVVKLDIRNCFPSIGHKRVFGIFREYLNFSDEISRVLTKITTFQNRLPQGAPTSSILANLALLPLHDEIQNICKQRSVKCTFFSDDITLSGDRAREVIGIAIESIQHHGFSVRSRKVKVLARHRDEQNITGITINSGKLTIGRGRKNQIRARIHRLSALSSMSSVDDKSLKSTIIQIKSISKAQGEKLEDLARRKLPKHIVQTKKIKKRDWHHCSSTHCHRHKWHKAKSHSSTKQAQ